MARALVSISGLVQGIGFRPFVYRIAVARGLRGYVKNLGDAGVDIDVTGEKKAIEAFLSDLEGKKPAIAIYTKVDVSWLDSNGDHEGFVIDRSDLGKREVKFSIIPPDLATCPDCLKELFDPRDRHHHYSFTCCALCGPRLTTIVDIPYDRDRTTMEAFPLCTECGRDFNDPLDRRFNAQTICCPECGPRMSLYNPDRSEVLGRDPIQIAAELIGEGAIVAVKGIGGLHLAVKATDGVSVLMLRKRRRKPGKPFALMSPDLEQVREYAIISEAERELLTSTARPIVALRKLDPFPISEHISPGLHTVGVMLPYSGIHHMLFHHTGESAMVMTSANFPGEPMATTNEEAFGRLDGVADYFLLHDREIYARADDSVVRMVDGNPLFLRRSRGYVPMPISLPFISKGAVAAVGSEVNSTAALLKADKCYPTQHLGEIDGPESLAFLEDALRHMLKIMRGGILDAVACDLHPTFLTKAFAIELAEESGVPLFDIQHHHAHLASLMADSHVGPGEEIVGLICDGYGYGIGGGAWGGEVFVGGYDSFRRVGHLEPQPMPGGDLSALRYGRMLQGVLYGEVPDDELREVLIMDYIQGFPQVEKEVDIVFDQLKKGVFTPKTTSAGRLLDAVSCLLGVSYLRTYEGEGAMKLEAFAFNGRKSTFSLPVDVDEEGGVSVLKTSQMVVGLLEAMGSVRREDLAYEFQRALADGLAEMALRAAEDQGVSKIGFSGGVANNGMITRVLRERVEGQGLVLLRHRSVPCGDGGVSLGQAAIASFKIE